jgi:hypothetical protein
MKRSVLIIAFALIGASTAQATLFDFTTGSPNNDNFGNVYEKTVDGITVQVRGFSVSGSGNFTESKVRVFATGLGTCASSETGSGCDPRQHTVDNDGRDEYLLLTFTAGGPVLLTEATITAWSIDFDATFWSGAGSLVSLLGLDIADLDNAYGRNHNEWDEVNNPAATGEERDVSLTAIESPVNWLVFGTQPGEGNDKFKFKSLALTVPDEDVPEPGTLLLVGIGAALLAVRSRNRRQA